MGVERKQKHSIFKHSELYQKEHFNIQKWDNPLGMM